MTTIDKMADDLQKAIERHIDGKLSTLKDAVMTEVGAVLKALPKPADGKDGKDGADGQQGPVGERGERGERGEKGAQGIQGQPGRDGAEGRDGSEGRPGPQGAPGRDGNDGAPGKDGSDGAEGQKGDKGERGEAGRDGERGKDGTSVDPEEVKSWVRSIVSESIPAVKSVSPEQIREIEAAELRAFGEALAKGFESA